MLESHSYARDYQSSGRDFKLFELVEKIRSPQKSKEIIRKEYSYFLKKWKKLQSLKSLYKENVFSNDLKRVKKNTKKPKLLSRILSSLKNDEERIKFFIIPSFIDRELMTLYEQTLLTGSKEDQLKRKKLDLALKNKGAFFLFMDDPHASYRRVILKKDNIKRAFHVDSTKNKRPQEEELFGEFAKKWFDEVIPMIELSELKVIEYFKSPGEWKLISLDKRSKDEYSFIVLELKRESFEKWLERF